MDMDMDVESFVPGLEGLVWPYRRDEFMRDYWQRRPLYVKGTERRLPHLRELLLGFDVERILAAADLDRTIVQPPLEQQRAPGERPAPRGSDVPSLLRLHAQGNQLYIATSGVPGVSDWVARLSQDLGRVWSTGQGDVYATRAGGGADIHFDRNDNFTIQLQGRKLWYFSSEPYYAQPLHNSGETEALPYDPTFVFDPSRIDTGRLEEVVLGPGDMFYMPRGFLHGTRADEDSLSFNLSLGAQPWADVLLEGLRARLIREPGWRETALRDSGAARTRIEAMQRILGELLADDLLAAPEEAPEEAAPGLRRGVLRRNPLAWWSCRGPAGEGCVTIEIHTPDRSITVLEAASEFLAILGAIPDGPRAIAPSELLRGWEHDAGAGHALVDALVSAGLLAWVDATHG
jgi:ribosomal protein L16 Arg81 hydroxylase